jgi:3-methyladenine DNA glycosylase/8-oxoguanine DNA glycosylase
MPAAMVHVVHDASGQRLRCVIEGKAEPADVRARVERLFDPHWDPQPAICVLSKSSLLCPRLRNLAGLRIPGCWDPFELCLRVILGQQVTVKGADTLMRRLAARCPQLTPDCVASSDLGSLGVPARRIRTLRALAEQAASGAIRFESQSWPEAAAQLSGIPGIGPWTIQYLAIRLGRDPDAFPDSDLGLLRATGARTPAELSRIAEKWRPYRAHAAMCLWMS